MTLVELDLTPFEKSVARLGEVLAAPESELTRDAAIQRFEFSAELAWKMIQRFARFQQLDCKSPREATRLALKQGWLDDDAVWVRLFEDRNLTSHTYNEAVAITIYKRLPAYHAAMRQLLATFQRFIAEAEEASDD